MGRATAWATTDMNPMICSALITIAGLLFDKEAILQISRPFAGTGHECIVFAAAFNSLNRCRASQVRLPLVLSRKQLPKHIKWLQDEWPSSCCDGQKVYCCIRLYCSGITHPEQKSEWDCHLHNLAIASFECTINSICPASDDKCLPCYHSKFWRCSPA